ncbi:MAG: HD domain-containing phosphohydrolase [Candidatus Eisenbacteria bacterium]
MALAAATPERTRVLCVDDEPSILEGLTLHLRRRYEVATATSGAEGLEILARDGSRGVILSDMRMPSMDGATFLKRSREVDPDAVRILLTGQTDLASAVAAVNEGRIFRFLSKPCPPPDLLAAVEAAAEQHRLITAERVLLEQTLHGSVKTLADVLSLTNPAAFGRAHRLQQIVTDMAARMGLAERWQVEVAAMLSPLGAIILPPSTIDKMDRGEGLSAEEQESVDRVPAVTESLLANIPRLDVVRGILASYTKATSPAPGLAESERQLVARGAALLRAATDFDALTAQGVPSTPAIDTMSARTERYDPDVLAALRGVRGGVGPHEEVREVPFPLLRVGMTLAEDVRTPSGVLLVARGFRVTTGLIERLQNMRRESPRDELRLVVRLDP